MQQSKEIDPYIQYNSIIMTLELITALIAFAFIGSLSPGPNNLLLLSSGINFGVTRTLPHLIGIGTGFGIMVFLVGIGLMQLFIKIPALSIALKIIGVLYLTYLAWKIATTKPPNTESGENNRTAKPMTFLQAVLFQWSNPKGWMLALTALSAYTPETPSLPNIVTVAIIFSLVMLPTISTWVLLGTQIKRFLKDEHKIKIFNITTALLLMASLYPVLMSG